MSNDNFIAHRGLAKVLLKATSVEMNEPRKKFLDDLWHRIDKFDVSAKLANLIFTQSDNSNWVIVLKTLIVTHHIMGHKKNAFLQHVASSSRYFELTNLRDNASVEGSNVSKYIRQYSQYLNLKIRTYRTAAFDFCKTKPGYAGTLETIPALQGQIDLLLKFDYSANGLSNNVVTKASSLLFRDLIQLVTRYNDVIMNLLEEFYHGGMIPKKCKEVIDNYQKLLVVMKRFSELREVVENLGGITKGDVLEPTRMVPRSLLEDLEGHLEKTAGMAQAVCEANTDEEVEPSKRILYGVVETAGLSQAICEATTAEVQNTKEILDGVVETAGMAQVVCEANTDEEVEPIKRILDSVVETAGLSQPICEATTDKLEPTNENRNFTTPACIPRNRIDASVERIDKSPGHSYPEHLSP